jgi:hypothetical protein
MRLAGPAPCDRPPGIFLEGTALMTRHGFACLALAALCSAPGAAAGQGAEEKTKVEVSLASEHVPADLKAGARVDLLRVDGKTAAGRVVLYRTTTVVPNIEVASVTRAAEKPKEPEQAVKVELLATKEQAALIEKAKRTLVTVVETRPGAPPETKRRPVTLRLEPAQHPDKK